MTDWRRQRTFGWVMVVIVAGGVTMVASAIRPEAIDGWNRYVAAVDERRLGETRDRSRFLVMDFQPGAVADRRTVMAGGLVVQSMQARGSSGEAIDVPSAMVHHWRGAVLLSGVSLSRLLTTLESDPPPLGPEVLAAAVLARGPGTMTLFLRLQRTRFTTVVYNTQHDITFAHDGPARASSVSVATRIAEVAEPNTAGERELPSSEDRGFLWRLRVYWRYEAVPGGVIVECESLSLSRTVPFGLGYIAGPLIASTARESMERTLQEMKRR